MLRANSRSSELVVMTLPLPKRGATSPALYTAWLDIMTKVTLRVWIFLKHWLKLNFRTCLQHSSSEATSNLSSPSTPSSLAGHEKLFIDYLFFYILKLSFELFLMTNVSHQESIRRCFMSEYEMLIEGIHVFTNHEVLTNCLILSQYPENWCVSQSYVMA